MRNGKVRSIFAVLCLICVGTATILAQTFTVAGQTFTWVPVSVFLTAPLAGTDVAVYDTKGNRIFEQADATNDQGVFPARVAALPRDFRVTATFDGNAQQDPVLGSLGRFTLSADVRDFDRADGIAYIDPATTLVSRVLDRDPQLGLDRARALVRHFLGLPEYASLGVALRQSAGYQSPYFSEAAFVKQAQQRGGMDSFLNDLVSQVLQPSLPTQAFVGAPTAVLGNPIAFIGTSLAYGAISYLGGQGIGWVLAKGGLVTPGATAAQIEEVQNSLADLQSSVANLSAQVEALNQQLTDIKYQQIVRPALDRASDINHVESKLSYYADQCPPLVESASPSSSPDIVDQFCRERKETIRIQLTDVRINGAFDAFSTALLDNPKNLSPGILHLGSQLVGQSVRFFRPADSTKIQNMFEYWKSAQTQAANLQVELAHLEGAQNSTGGVKELRDFLGDPAANPPTLGKFQNTLNEEGKLIFPSVPTGTVVDTSTRRMWLTARPEITSLPNCRFTANPVGMPPGASYFIGSWTVNGLFWVVPTTDEANELIKGWKGTSPNAWLTEQTQAVAPEVPASRGFANLIALNGNGCAESPSIFINDPGMLTPLRLMDLRNGTIRDHKRLAWDWLFMTRRLGAKEQYYWYPNQ